MATGRFKDVSWGLPKNKVSGNIENWTHVQIAVLMDIRDELQTLNRVFACPNFTAIPRILQVVATNTKKRKYVRKVK